MGGRHLNIFEDLVKLVLMLSFGQLERVMHLRVVLSWTKSCALQGRMSVTGRTLLMTSSHNVLGVRGAGVSFLPTFTGSNSKMILAGKLVGISSR